MSTKSTATTKGNSTVMKIVAIVLAIVVIGLAVFSFVSGKGILLRSKTAAQSENFKVSGTEMAYFASSQYQQFCSSLEDQFGSEALSYFGIDATRSLKDQVCSMYSDGGTWHDYFVDSAKASVSELLALAEYAKANGIELGDEERKTLDDTLAYFAEGAAQNNFTTDGYIGAIFKNGVNSKDVKGALELQLLASKAATEFDESVDVSAETLEKYYSDNREDFDGVDYYAFTLQLPDGEEAPEGSEEDTVVVDDAALIAFITEIAAVKDVETYKSFVYDYEKYENPDADEDTLNGLVESTLQRHTTKPSVSDEELAKWLFEEAKVGEVKLVTDEENGAYIVYVFVKEAYRDEEMGRNVRHILVAFDEENPDDDTKAQEILDELKAADFSPEKWNELAAEYSIDSGSNTNGGLYENMARYGLLTQFGDWLFDENRVEGDSGIVKTTAGWHVMYYGGEYGKTPWEVNATNGVKNEAYSAMIEEKGAGVTFDDGAFATLTIN